MNISKFDLFPYWLIMKIANGDMIKINGVSFAGDYDRPAYGKKGFIFCNIAYESYPPPETEHRCTFLMQGNLHFKDHYDIPRTPPPRADAPATGAYGEDQEGVQ